MAARTPTAYVAIDLGQFESGLDILASPLDDVLDNFEFYLDHVVPGLATCFKALSTTNTGGYNYMRRWWMAHRDECGTFDDGSVNTGSLSVRVWSSSALVNIDVLATTRDAAGVTLDTATFSVSGTTTATWSTLQSIDVETNGSAGSIEIDIKPSAAGTVYIGGVFYEV